MRNDFLQILDPLHDPSWDDRVRSCGACSFFHTSSWARVLADSYGYRPHYAGEVRNGELTALLPVMEVSSFLTGRRGVSLPFTDQCEPVACDAGSYRGLLESVIGHGRRAGWRYLELRSGAGMAGATPPFTVCLGHTLDLRGGPERLAAGLRDSTRRNIKRARNSGVRISISCAAGPLEEFCRLNCMTRREHGLPPQPARFFKNILLHVLARERGIVVLASQGGRTIAGAVYFHFGTKAVYKYGASDRNYQHLRANNLIMWEAIQGYAANGYTTFDFGRTEPENEGLLQFKRGWGAEEHPLPYFRYDLRKEAFVAGSLKVSGAHTSYFRRMPIPVLKMAGSLLYRHMG
jgi:hypothetical protein